MIEIPINDSRIKKVEGCLNADQKFEVFQELLLSKYRTGNDSEKEIQQLVAGLEDKDRYRFRELLFGSIQEHQQYIFNKLCSETLSKNLFMILEAQRARLCVIQDSFLPEGYLWKKDNEKIGKNLEELSKCMEENYQTDYAKYLEKEKEHFNIVFELKENFERGKLKFGDEKKFFAMTKEQDEEKRLEYMPMLKLYKSQVNESHTRESEAIEEAKETMKCMELWKQEYEKQCPINWITDGMLELKKRRKEMKTEKFVEQISKAKSDFQK